MTISDDEDESLAQFLETEVLSEVSDQEEYDDMLVKEPNAKRRHTIEDDETENQKTTEKHEHEKGSCSSSSPAPAPAPAPLLSSSSTKTATNKINTESLTTIPHEVFRNILKFLSSEDLIACSLVCRFLNQAASDESLWQRLYRMRWGLLPPTGKLRESTWKKLYIQRDEDDMVKLGTNCPVEFKEYYIQMQAAKRSQTPLPSQANDDGIILDKTVAEKVTMWKRSKGLTDKVVTDHTCSGEKCTYHQIEDAFVCEKTGQVHVCDENCRETVMDPGNLLWVCTVSGHCFDNMLSPPEEDSDAEQAQEDPTDDAEPFMGSGRFARAYSMGYYCSDEKELEALRFR